MNRRTSLQSMACWTAACLLSPYTASGRELLLPDKGLSRHFLSTPTTAEVPEGKRLPFSWQGFQVGPVAAVRLRVDKPIKVKNAQSGILLRCAVAIDIRDEKLIKARIPETHEDLGVLDVRYSAVFHVFDLDIDPKLVPAINEKGIELVLDKGDNPAWFFSATPGYTDKTNGFRPQLLVYQRDSPELVSHFIDQLCSLNSIQPFGWMEGCVLDGLHQLYLRKGKRKALKTIRLHLSQFFDQNGNFIHEDPQSRPLDNKISTIETTLPFATLATLEPDHPYLNEVLAFWDKLTNEQGLVIDYASVTGEGAYTIGYPMAVLGKQRGDRAMMAKAYQQIQLRKQSLVRDGDIYLRHYPKDGSSRYRNWARGVTWYLLGTVRTIEVLRDQMDISDAIAEVRRVAEMVVELQLDNGLWPCFLNEPEVRPDTSGSAGIAAAMAVAVNYGWLSPEYKVYCRKTYQALLQNLSPDGLLRGVAQSNKKGEELQRSDYRVTSQMGMGLMAQLYAAL